MKNIENNHYNSMRISRSMSFSASIFKFIIQFKDYKIVEYWGVDWWNICQLSNHMSIHDVFLVENSSNQKSR